MHKEDTDMKRRRADILQSLTKESSSSSSLTPYTAYLLEEDKANFTLALKVIGSDTFPMLPIETRAEIYLNHFSSGRREIYQEIFKQSEKKSSPKGSIFISAGRYKIEDMDEYVQYFVKYQFRDNLDAIEGLPFDWVLKMALGACPVE